MQSALAPNHERQRKARELFVCFSVATIPRLLYMERPSRCAFLLGKHGTGRGLIEVTDDAHVATADPGGRPELAAAQVSFRHGVDETNTAVASDVEGRAE